MCMEAGPMILPLYEIPVQSRTLTMAADTGHEAALIICRHGRSLRPNAIQAHPCVLYCPTIPGPLDMFCHSLGRDPFPANLEHPSTTQDGQSLGRSG
ncbi:hypothetical protein BaRGS_00013947 [Batillaria attramentaria]|uniref:Uncharacterized protein n=1 Tax=Batillaria attramentaria TaxID=370345 RepID=A0ABD0L601_9CAEN